MIKKIFCGWLLLAIFISMPASARQLFIETKERATTGSAAGVINEEEQVVRSFKLKYANAEALKTNISDLLTADEKASVNIKMNTIVVKASPQSMKRIAGLIAEMDKAPSQVRVEAKIIELKSNIGDSTDPSTIGVNWKYSHSTNDYVQLHSADMGNTSLGLYAQLISGNVEAYLEALNKTVGYDLIASPWVTALNHEQAQILIGSKYGYKTSVITETSTVQEVNFLEVGTKLTFTPHINEDGYIIMDIYPSISEGSVVNELPQENTTETQNKVLVKNGQAIVIGGLTKNYNQEVEIGIPIIMHIPYLGNLFKRTELVSEKRDIMIIITPRIVDAEYLAEMEKQAKEFEEKNKKAAEEKKLIR
ncbi:MAG: hypothetical protein KKB81_03300 [Candidatus Margulisbacteria bacterium]|nr:hypothetical protein [Candidatus Margulisiibacteriota bacterium]MBU1022272.1 hypothetical protein [Candidatus Margulisiibacteriota bacterium]MBU1729289.1 hypothetical protein [Candidatus Margulisiibacteriota bacterium]MBU1955562.1 hypothetical protein [Candidatus Margulisiibacteriota bacterium]